MLAADADCYAENFCDLVDSESFTEAAERNGVTQSAVSQQMRALESITE